jgi:hypothetical protein
MATTFKTFLNNDIATTRTLLHEAIPITGTIASGTYVTSPATDNNVKTYGHGMFQSVYDYPYLSSSANHIFDITVGLAASASGLAADGTEVTNAPGQMGKYGSYYNSTMFNASAQYEKKRNIYDQMAQVLLPYDVSGNIQRFDRNGNFSDVASTKLNEAIFINFARLLTKDEIKKGTFTIQFLTGGTTPANRGNLMTISDYGASSSFKVNSPTGEYGLLYTSSANINDESAVGQIFYQAGVCVLTPYIFTGHKNVAGAGTNPLGSQGGFHPVSASMISTSSFTNTGSAANKYNFPHAIFTGSSIDNYASGVRNRLYNIQFNNTTELNSTIYFCRANTGDYNYSSNPTYLNASKIRVKGDNPFAQPVSYITTIGLYSPNNELLAVAKLSEPLKKTPSNEMTLRVRLDY